MIVLTFDMDPGGRPILELFATASPHRIAALHAAGETTPRPEAVRALVDTGASRSNLDRSIVARLDLDSVGEATVHTASTGSTPKVVREYNVQLFLPGLAEGLIAEDLRVLEAEDLSGLGVEMLLGRDVIDQCLLIYSGQEGRFTFAFGKSGTGR